MKKRFLLISIAVLSLVLSACSEKVEAEAIPTTAQPAENLTEENPEPNTSKMVDYLAREAKKSATQAATEEKRNEAVSFIADNYPDYFKDNETMESTIYYGYFLEYAYADNGPENLYANLGMDAYQAVKGVYRNVDKAEDDIVQENLLQIKEALSQLGLD